MLIARFYSVDAMLQFGFMVSFFVAFACSGNEKAGLLAILYSGVCLCLSVFSFGCHGVDVVCP